MAMRATDDDTVVDGRVTSVLTIAGSDSGGGAGIQTDLKTFAAHGVHGLSAIAALTAQNTRGVSAVHAPDVSFLCAQIDACFEDFDVRAVKLGMLATAGIIHAVTDALEHWKPAALVIDPVMVATSGAQLLANDALDALRTRLLPMATVLTPNLPEAELLLGRRIAPGADADRSLAELLEFGSHAVLLKGGHLAEGEVIDRFGSGVLRAAFRSPRLPVEGHGTGCTLASAIAANLALGESPQQACRLGTGFIAGALAAGYRPGRGEVVVLDPFWRFHKA